MKTLKLPLNPAWIFTIITAERCGAKDTVEISNPENIPCEMSLNVQCTEPTMQAEFVPLEPSSDGRKQKYVLSKINGSSSTPESANGTAELSMTLTPGGKLAIALDTELSISIDPIIFYQKDLLGYLSPQSLLFADVMLLDLLKTYHGYRCSFKFTIPSSSKSQLIEILQALGDLSASICTTRSRISRNL